MHDPLAGHETLASFHLTLPAFIGPLPLVGMPVMAHGGSAPVSAGISIGPAQESGTSSPSLAVVAATPSSTISQAQVDALAAGFGQTLSAIQANLVQQVFADTLPVVGNNLLEAANSGAPQLGYLTSVKDAITAGLGTLQGGGTYTEAQVASALNTALAGFGAASPNFSDAADLKLNFTTTKNLGALTTPIESDLGLPGLGVSTSGNAQTTFNHALNFATGLDATGFYLSTAGQPNYQIATNTTLPGFRPELS